jgi:hypothetical protein
LISSVAPAIGTLKRDVTSSYLSITGGTSPNSNGATILLSGSTYVAANTAFVDATESVFRSLNGASEYMRLTTTGLGIGTSSPAYKLDVNGQVRVNNDFLISDASAIRGRLYGDATGVLWRAESGLAQRWAIGSTEVMRLDSSGNLGIGTSSPQGSLDVTATGVTVNQFLTGGAGNNLVTGIFRIGSGLGRGASIQGFRGASSNIHSLDFYTYNSVDVFGMRLDSSGNLGIGTSSPGQRLEIQAPAGASQNAVIRLRATDSGSSSGCVADISAIGTGGQVSALAFSTRDGTNILERMRLDGAGNLGLGVTPSAWGSSQNAAQVGNLGLMYSPASNTNSTVTHNAYYDGTNWRYITSSVAAARYEMTGANSPGSTHSWSVSAGGTAGNAISFTQAMTLDASGNLLVGTTSAVYGGQLSVKSVGQTSLSLQNSNFVAASAGTQLNSYFGATTGDTYAALQVNSGGGLAFNNLVLQPNGGNLLVGTTSAIYSSKTVIAYDPVSTNGPIIVDNRAFGVDRGGAQWFGGQYNTAGNYRPYSGVIGAKENATDGNSAGFLAFYTNGNAADAAERARITSGGYFKASNTGTYSSSTNDRYEFTSDKNDLTILVNSTNTGANVNNVYSQLPAGANAGAYHFVGSISGSGLQFTVDADGDVKNTNNSYGSISDIKLKQDVVDATSQWDDIKALRVRKYRFKRNPDAALQIGLVAQEAEAVSPGLVEETADRDEEGNDLGTTTKSVKYSVLYMKAVKALQEAMARIEQLETRVAALEA